MNPLLIRQLLQQALLEDIGTQDLTTELIFGPQDILQGTLFAKSDGRIAGLAVAQEAFHLLDASIQMEHHLSDGSEVTAGTVLAHLSGSARAILSAERVALNLIQRMSGIATATQHVCQAVSHTAARITDTRKTLPGLRMLDKYAVRVGGGVNHRFGLYDAVMIKDNHIAACGSITEAVSRVRAGIGHLVKVEVEADTLEQVEEAVKAQADVILFDNMKPHVIQEALLIVQGRALTEASGGIHPNTVKEYAETGVDYISLGWLTHSVTALDISLDLS